MNSGADQVNNAIQQLNQVTQQNAASSEELATSAEELSSQADQLKQIISYFKVENNGRDSFKFQSKKTNFTTKPSNENGNGNGIKSKQKEVSSPAEQTRKTEEKEGFELNMYNADSNDKEFENF